MMRKTEKAGSLLRFICISIEFRKREGGLFLFRLNVGKRISPGSNTKRLVINVCVDLGSIQMLVAQDLLHSLDIDTILQHQCCSCVPQLVGRILAAVKSGLIQMFFDKGVYIRAADPLIPGG